MKPGEIIHIQGKAYKVIETGLVTGHFRDKKGRQYEGQYVAMRVAACQQDT